MKITVTELKARNEPFIALLEIISMDGRFYMGRLHLDDGVRILSDEAGNALLYSGTWAIKDELRAFDVASIEILPPPGYDEMVGMPGTSSDLVRVPLDPSKS